MDIKVQFYSYFKDLAGCAETIETLPDASKVGDLLARVAGKHPRLGPMQKSMLVAVGVDYQDRDYVLQPGDEVSLFPPVQGG
jgi:molybdopterin converting factor small subunit